jgi:NAD(P)-dependent dehydrogenase (short-subunit alcohol dehydrogenase family)
VSSTDLLRGRSILVTGGAGAIGSLAVRTLADHGAQVVANDVIPERTAIAAIDDERVAYLRGDGSTRAGADRLIRLATKRMDGLTDVVLLAGTVLPGGLLEQTRESIDRTFDINVAAATITAQAAVRRWTRSQQPGNLVFVSSWVQDVAWPGIAPYSASKAAMRSMARSFAREFAAAGIRANVLAPGIVGVGMARRQWDDEPDYRRRARRAVPLGDLQAPSSVADALVFLCSPMSSYMTGSSLLVDGGASLYPLDPEELGDDSSG